MLAIAVFKRNFILFLLILSFLLLCVFRINAIYFVGDESVYSESVYTLINGKLDSNNHPLLAKTIWAFFVFLAQGITGTDKPVYWRFGNILFSTFTLILFYKLSRLFFRKNLSIFTTFLLALDPMYFSFARTMNLDVISLFFNLGALYYLFKYFKNVRVNYLYTSFFLLGLALAVKLSLAFYVIILPFVLILLKEFRKLKIIEALIVVIEFYLFTFLGFILGNFLYFIINHYNISFLNYVMDLIYSQIMMERFSSNYLYSTPISWFIIPQILTLYRLDFVNKVETVIALQNPVLFASALLSFFYTFYRLLINKIKKAKFWSIIILLFLLQYIPLFFNLHTTYYYYIIPLLPLIIIMFVNMIKDIKYSKFFILSSLMISIIIFAAYYPLLVGLPVAKKYELMLYKYSIYQFPEKDSIFCQNCYPRK